MSTDPTMDQEEEPQQALEPVLRDPTIIFAIGVCALAVGGWTHVILHTRSSELFVLGMAALTLPLLGALIGVRWHRNDSPCKKVSAIVDLLVIAICLQMFVTTIAGFITLYST